VRGGGILRNDYFIYWKVKQKYKVISTGCMETRSSKKNLEEDG
jgi:hypothetical protein